MTFDSALAGARRPESRATWRLYKAFPHLLQPGPDGLCVEQELYAIAHTVLDDGRDYCPACHELVEAAVFCAECGTRLHEARVERPCPTKGCTYRGPARWCPRDGARVMPETLERVARGEATWTQEINDAWAMASKMMPPDEDDALRRRREAVARMPE